MKRQEILTGTILFLLLLISLFDYSRQTQGKTPNGSYVGTIDLDGASLVAIGIGIAATFSVRSINRQVKALSERVGLPLQLPRIAYEWLPLALAPFLLVGFSRTITSPMPDGTVAVTTGFGNSHAKIWMLLLLCVLVYLAKLRTRLTEISQKSRDLRYLPPKSASICG